MALSEKQKSALTTIFNTLDRNDLDFIIQLHKNRFGAISANEAAQFTIGDTVSFTARGSIVEGIVERVNRKTIKVNCNRTHAKWSVSPSFLTKVA